jgi:hypothetical protein
MGCLVSLPDNAREAPLFGGDTGAEIAVLSSVPRCRGAAGPNHRDRRCFCGESDAQKGKASAFPRLQFSAPRYQIWLVVLPDSLTVTLGLAGK